MSVVAVSKLSKVERGRAALRLAEEHVVPLRELTALAGASEQAMTSWITEGRAGVHLDAVRDTFGAWTSSAAAVARFLADWARVSAEKELDRLGAVEPKGGAA